MSTTPEHTGSSTQRRPVPDDLGRALLDALGAWRPQAISLHDAAGDTLWLSAGTMGPDEHSLVLTALDVFALEPYREHIHRKLEDGRRTLFLAARDPTGNCIGVLCAFVERSAVDDERVVTPALHALLQRFSMLLAPHTDKTSSQSSLTLGRDGNLPFSVPELTPIRARKYLRLQSGSGTRRYEVVINPVSAPHDAAVFEHVVDWLAQNRQHYLEQAGELRRAHFRRRRDRRRIREPRRGQHEPPLARRRPGDADRAGGGLVCATGSRAALA